MTGPGAGGLNDTVLQNSSSGFGIPSKTRILLGLAVGHQTGLGAEAARLRRAIARSHRRHEVTEDRSRCQEVFGVEKSKFANRLKRALPKFRGDRSEVRRVNGRSKFVVHPSWRKFSDRGAPRGEFFYDVPVTYK